jgi:hypothetical protein
MLLESGGPVLFAIGGMLLVLLFCTPATACFALGSLAFAVISCGIRRLVDREKQ